MLGRVIIGDIAATPVDLSLRGVLAVERRDEVARPAGSSAPGPAGHQSGALLSYERILADAREKAARRQPCSHWVLECRTS